MLTLTSDPKNVSRVEPFVDQLISDYAISPELYGNILITLTEAVTNAIVHGNNEDESKKVCISCSKRRNRLNIHVTDEGSGFDYDGLPDPTTPENLLKIGGRGVFLMKQLSDEVSFDDDGRTVKIMFTI